MLPIEENARTRNLILRKAYTTVYNTFASMWADLAEASNRSDDRNVVKAYRKAMFEFEGSCQRIEKIMAKRWVGFQSSIDTPWDEIEIDPQISSDLEDIKKYVNLVRADNLLGDMTKVMIGMLKTERDGYLRNTIEKTYDNVERVREGIQKKGDRYV